MPKEFQFRLEPVLKFRRIVEENKKKELALARRAIEEQRMTLATLASDETSGKERLRRMLVGDLDLTAVRHQMAHIHAIARDIRDGEQRMEQLRKVEDVRREDFIRARKDVRVLERLRERRKEGYDAELRRFEQKFLDDVAVGMRRFRLEQGECGAAS